MYYLYFSYAFIAAIWVLLDTLKEKASKLWAILIFLSPVTTPFYFLRLYLLRPYSIKTSSLKSKVKQKLIPALIAFFLFAGVCAGEYFIYFNKKTKLKYSNYSPIARQMIKLCNSMKILTNKFDHDIEKLNGISRSESSLENITTTINIIGDMRMAIIDYNSTLAKFSSFVKLYRKNLEQDNLNWLVAINGYYNNQVMIIYFKKLKLYLDNFESLLQYTFKHFHEIGKRIPVALDNYDAYYLRYRMAMDDYNKAGNMRVDFQNNFLKTHWKLKEFLPDVLKMNSLELKSKLRLWK